MDFPGDSVVKNPPAIQEMQEIMGSVLELVRFPGEGDVFHSSIPAWKVPRTEETGGLQSMGSHRVRHD